MPLHMLIVSMVIVFGIKDMMFFFFFSAMELCPNLFSIGSPRVCLEGSLAAWVFFFFATVLNLTRHLQFRKF